MLKFSNGVMKHRLWEEQGFLPEAEAKVATQLYYYRLFILFKRYYEILNRFIFYCLLV